MKRLLYGGILLLSAFLVIAVAAGREGISFSAGDPEFGLRKLIYQVNCGPGKLELSVRWPVLGTFISTGLFDVEPRYELIFQDGPQQIQLLRWVANQFPGSSVPTWTGYGSIPQSRVFLYADPSMVDVVGLSSVGEKPAPRTALFIAGSEASLEEYRAIERCVSDNLDVLNSRLVAIGGPIASIHYLGFTKSEPAAREFSCADPARTIVLVLAGRVRVSSSSTHWVGYITEAHNFRPVDLMELRGEFLGQGRILSAAARAELEYQGRFQENMRPFLANCRNVNDMPFLEIYPAS